MRLLVSPHRLHGTPTRSGTALICGQPGRGRRWQQGARQEEKAENSRPGRLLQPAALETRIVVALNRACSRVLHEAANPAINAGELSMILIPHCRIESWGSECSTVRGRLLRLVPLLLVSQAWFTVKNSGHAPADDIPHPQPIQRAKEQKAKVRFGHG